jgi:HSP20 family protein
MFHEHKYHSGRINYNGCGHRGGGRMFGQGFRRVPANIEETENSFIIHLFAPALAKEHLRVVTKDDVLTISYTPKEDGQPIEKFNRREYSNGAFERAFALNGKVLSENITAAYAEGILKVTLPKNPETNTPEKDISVD